VSTPTTAKPRKTRKPPAAGKGTSVKVDQEMHDDMAVLMSTGRDASDAMRHAVSLIAWAYRNAWAAGVCPEGEEPKVLGFQVVPYPPAEQSEAA
jgi:hypothetical protein